MSCIKFGVKLRSEEEAERDDIEPEEQRDACAERSVDLGVVGEARDVPAKGERSQEPRQSGESRAGHDTLPGLPHGGSQVINKADDDGAADKGNDPADEDSGDEDRSASRGHDMRCQPHSEEVAEDDEDAGESKGNERKRDQKKSAKTALHEGPAVDG